MSNVYKTLYGKSAFGTLKNEVYQSDYINRKKNRIVCCKYSSTCNKSPTCNTINVRNTKSYEKLYSFKKCPNNMSYLAVNPNNLVMGQYSKINLRNVCEAVYQPTCVNIYDCSQCDVPVRMSVDPDNGRWNSGATAFYNDVSLDPLGELFGNSQCGQLNYYKYREVG